MLGEDKFTLQNFSRQISGVMLQRGKDYFDNGAVVNIEDNNGEWCAEIEGAETYTANVTLEKGGEITSCFCDCPYDGDICKHLVAVFFAMCEEVKKSNARPEKPGKASPFEKLLKNIDIEEYRAFIKHFAKKDKNFKLEFELYFAEKDDDTDIAKLYAGIIQKLIKKYSGRGYIDYRSGRNLANEVDQIIYKGKDLIQKKNFADAFAMAAAVIAEMTRVLTYTDDSSGSLSGTLSYAIELLQDIANDSDVAMALKERIFEFLGTAFTDDIFWGYSDHVYELLSIFEDLALLLNKSETYLNFIDARLTTVKDDSYMQDHLKRLKIGFLKNTGKENEAEALIQQNLDIAEVRQGEVDKAIGKGAYDTAKTLIAGGITIAQADNYPGIVFQWEKQLLRIAELEKDTPLMRHYYKRFAFGRWLDREYYNKWKKTYLEIEWAGIIEDHINTTISKVTANSKKNSWQPLSTQLLDALAAIYIEEKYLERLYALVAQEKGSDKIMQYHSYLIHSHPAELLTLYLPALERKADAACDRSGYADLVHKMQKIIADIPFSKEKMLALAQLLKAKYPRRPALIDELNKLK